MCPFALGDGFSLVLYERGSVDDLVACALSLGVTSVEPFAMWPCEPSPTP